MHKTSLIKGFLNGKSQHVYYALKQVDIPLSFLELIESEISIAIIKIKIVNVMDFVDMNTQNV